MKTYKNLFNIVLVLLLFISFYYLYDYLKLVSTKSIIKNNIKEDISLLEKNKTYDLDYYKNYYSNIDIVGSIKIRNTNIYSLLVRGIDNEYYLNHSIKKELDEVGSIFVDYRTDLNSKQINIYGHNSNVYDVMFKELENYLDSSYYLGHEYIELWNGLTTNIYKIFSIQIVSSDYEHIDVNPSNWKNHISKLNNSIYKTGAMATADDNIMIIQTCLYEPADSFLVINARKV